MPNTVRVVKFVSIFSDKFDKIFKKDHQVVKFLQSAAGANAVAFGALPNFNGINVIEVDDFSAGVAVGLVYDLKNEAHPWVAAAQNCCLLDKERQLLTERELLGTQREARSAMIVKRFSLTTKLIAYLLPVIVSILGVDSYFKFQYAKQALEDAMGSKADSKLTSLVSVTSYYLSNFETDLVEAMVEDVQAEKEVMFIAVINNEEKVEYGAVIKAENIDVFDKEIPSEDGAVGRIQIGLDTSPLKATLRSMLINNLVLLLLMILIISR